jgi:hypothetical protein
VQISPPPTSLSPKLVIALPLSMPQLGKSTRKKHVTMKPPDMIDVEWAAELLRRKIDTKLIPLK